jgi:hypothetical protein
MTEITHIFNAVASGDPQGSAELLPLDYAKLGKPAAARLAGGREAGQMLNPTGLVHEAYWRLVGNHLKLKWDVVGQSVSPNLQRQHKKRLLAATVFTFTSWRYGFSLAEQFEILLVELHTFVVA